MQTPSAESTSKIGGSTLRIGRTRISAVGGGTFRWSVGEMRSVIFFENDEMINTIKWAQFGRQSSEVKKNNTNTNAWKHLG